MCGIAGIINFKGQKVTEQAVSKMINTIKHRGPDDEGIFIDDAIGLGFVRLSIIDLSPAGHQPKVSSDGEHVIIFNGEIFNYLELRAELEQEGVKFTTRTDTEVLLNAYIHWGENCLHKFNGMWSFAIYSKKSKSVFIARDRYGVKPLYYYKTNSQFVFCSEIPALLPYLENNKLPNYQAIFDYLIFNRTDQTEDTFFIGIKKLQHGHYLKISNESVINVRWYDIKSEAKKAKGFKNEIEFKEELTAAINLRLRSDVPVGVCLSGGLDSSSIVSILLNNPGVKDLNTFSAIYNKGQIGDETEFINEFKPVLNKMHFINPTAKTLMQDLNEFVKAHAEPIPSTSPYAQYKVMQLAKGKVTVTLDGQGADEHLGGYHYFFGFYFKDLFKNFKLFTLTKEMVWYLKNHKSLFALKTFVYFLLPEKLKTTTRISEKDYLNEEFMLLQKSNNNVSKNIYSSSTLQDAFFDHFEYKLEHLLKWEDRNSMHFSLEARVPFLDHKLVERSLATNNSWKIKKGTTKFILRESLKDVLPEKIRMRQDKIGFGTPQDEWFREPEWQKFIKDIIGSDSFKNRKIIDADKAIYQYEQHLLGKVNVSREIWKWIHLELWFREYFDNNENYKN